MIAPPPIVNLISGVILAGGRGYRLGGTDKALQMLAGRPLVAHVAARLAPQLPAGRLMLNANGSVEQFAQFALPVFADDVAGQPGPLAGILAAIRSTEKGVAWVFSAPTDTPFLPSDLVARLAADAEIGGVEIVLAASSGGLCQVCGLWSTSLEHDLAAALASGRNKVLAFAERHRWRQVEFPPVDVGAAAVDPFFNINTPEDLAIATGLLNSAQTS